MNKMSNVINLQNKKFFLVDSWLRVAKISPNFGDITLLQII